MPPVPANEKRFLHDRRGSELRTAVMELLRRAAAAIHSGDSSSFYDGFEPSDDVTGFVVSNTDPRRVDIGLVDLPGSPAGFAAVRAAYDWRLAHADELRAAGQEVVAAFRLMGSLSFDGGLALGKRGAGFAEAQQTGYAMATAVFADYTTAIVWIDESGGIAMAASSGKLALPKRMGYARLGAGPLPRDEVRELLANSGMGELAGEDEDTGTTLVRVMGVARAPDDMVALVPGLVE